MGWDGVAVFHKKMKGSFVESCQRSSSSHPAKRAPFAVHSDRGEGARIGKKDKGLMPRSSWEVLSCPKRCWPGYPYVKMQTDNKLYISRACHGD